MAKLTDGYQSLISFADDTSVVFYEKEITPPGVSGGGEIDITNMQTSTWRQKAPKSLKTLEPASMVVHYDPLAYNEVIAMLNSNQQITITFPDASTIVFWGWIDGFTPGNLVEGEAPTADLTIIPSNRNASGVETAPVIS